MVIFILENFILTENREYIINKVNIKNYHYLYNTISSAAMIGLGITYYKYRKTGYNMPVSFKSKFIGNVCITSGLIGMSQLIPGLQIPIAFDSNNVPSIQPSQSLADKIKSFKWPTPKLACPIDFKTGKSIDGLTFMERISRHSPLFIFGITSFGIACKSSYLISKALYGMPLLVAFTGAKHKDYRYRNNNGGTLTTEIEEKTSFYPFGAFIRGKQDWSLIEKETKYTNLSIVILYMILFGHK